MAAASRWSLPRGVGAHSRGLSLTLRLPLPLSGQEEELVELLARHCYVQLGASAGRAAVQELLPGVIPAKLYRTKPPEKWASLVSAAHAKVSLQGAWARFGGRGPAGRGPSPRAPRPLGHRRPLAGWHTSLQGEPVPFSPAPPQAHSTLPPPSK